MHALAAAVLSAAAAISVSTTALATEGDPNATAALAPRPSPVKYVLEIEDVDVDGSKASVHLVGGFPGSLESFAIDLAFVNNTTATIDQLIVSGRRANVVWDSFGTQEVTGVTASLDGEDTDTVRIRLGGFGPGKTLSFIGIDPDLTGEPSSGVTVGGLDRVFVSGTTANPWMLRWGYVHDKDGAMKVWVK